MRAIRLHSFGPAENLRLEELPEPVPAEGQVRVDVRVSGVHLIETRLRRGIAVGPHRPPELPITPGSEVAGVVGAVGPGVSADWLGRRVVVQLGDAGGYAEQALADESALYPIPDELADDVAVAAITTGTTAQGVLGVARLTERDVVLVMSAAGGLGSLFVQAAKAAGALVVGVAGGARRWPGCVRSAPTSRWTTPPRTGPSGYGRRWRAARSASCSTVSAVLRADGRWNCSGPVGAS